MVDKNTERQELKRKGNVGENVRLPKPSRGPSIEIDVPISTMRKTFAVKETLVKDLAEYAAYLTEHHGKAIDEDRVIEGLLATLSRDKSFGAWKSYKEAL